MAFTWESSAQEVPKPDAASLEDVESPRLADNAKALPGFIRMSAAVPSRALVSLAAQGSYGLFNPVSGFDGPSVKWSGLLGVGVTPIKYFSARFSLRGDYNRSATTTREKVGSLYGEPEIGLRAQLPMDRLYLGAELETRFVGSEAPNIDFSATTPTLRALATYDLNGQTWLGAQFGFRWDQSHNAIDDLDLRDDVDRRTLSASSFNAVELGLAASHRWGKLEVLGELSADVLVGRDAPRFKEDPISFDVGARYDLLPDLNLRAHLEYSPTTYRIPYPTDFFIASRPRFEMGLGLSVHFGVAKAPPPVRVEGPQEAKKDPTPSPPPVLVPETGGVRGRVIDEAGQPIPDVRVVLSSAEGEAVEVYTDERGEFNLPQVLTGPSAVEFSTPGFDPVTQQIDVEKDADQVVEATLYESLPAGQVRGRVLDFNGEPLAATVTISPGDAIAPVSADGSFSIDLKPGKYKVRFTYEGYTPQIRVVHVQDKGVVVLNIALHK